MAAKIVVGMADLKVAKAPTILTTIGLGSCIGIALYDTRAKVAGLAHIMLPDSTAIASNTNPAKFADTAVIKLISDMSKLGAVQRNIVAKIAGGAQMFNFTSTNESLRVGDRNIEATKRVLMLQRIPLLAEDTGKSFGRTVELDAVTGKLLIKTIGQGNKVI